MADNTTLNTNTTSGDVIATDDISGVKYQRVKLVHGQDGVNDGDVAHANPLPVHLNTGTQDVFRRIITGTPNNDVDIQWFRSDPANLADVTTNNGGTAVSNNGGALFSSSTDVNGNVTAISKSNTVYRSGSEIYVLFTAAFVTPGIASSVIRVGLYDGSDGFFIGYEGTSFGVTVRRGGVDTTVAKGSFSEDDLTGGATSMFRRDGAAEAIDLAKLNVYRIRFGWLGSAPCYWEVMAPDGEWVTFHVTRFPNLQTTPSIENADLPMRLDITKTSASATNLQVQTDCWGAGTTVAEQNGIVDLTNSRTGSSTLSAGTSWNASGAFVDVHRYSLTTIIIDTTTNNASGTLYAEFSADGSTVHRTITYTVEDASTHPPHTLVPVAEFLRVRYDADAGGGNDHAAFMVQTMHHVSKSAKLTSRLDSSIVDSTDVDNVRAVIVAKTSGGTYTNVASNSSGKLQVAAEITAEATEDDAAAANPVGNHVVAVRHDAPEGTAAVTADGDVVALRSDLLGRLKVTELPDAQSEIKYAVIDDAVSGNNTLVAAVASRKIRVISLFLVAAGSVTARFEDGAGGTALTGQMNLTANSGFVLPYNPAGWFQTSDNTLLNLELSAAVSVDGSLTYVEV